MKKYSFSEAEQAHIENSLMPFAIYQFIDKRVVTIVLSKGFCDLFGYEDKSLAYYDMNNNMYKDTHEDDAAKIAEAAIRFATEGGKYNVIYRTKNSNGSGYKIIHAQGEHFYTETGVRLAQIWYTDEGSFDFAEFCGSTDEKLRAGMKNAIFMESLGYASSYDHLTGLPGMTYFFDLSTSKREAIRQEGGVPSLMFMDFSGMKYYNHKYGFSEGDTLLRSFARLLAQYFGNENCCRLGQDHFAVITAAEGLEDTLEKLFAECAGLNNSHSLPLHVGIYQNWYDGIIASMACDRAKYACDTLKSKYTSVFSYYDLSMKNAEEKHQYIIANLDKAISERWIKVYYQPIVRAVNDRVCDEEALARWIDPVKGFMSPGDFIPVLEDHKLIYKLDLYVVECVLKKIKIFEKAGFKVCPQSVNLSRSDFDCCDIVEEIRRRVDDSGVSRGLITIEITESVIGSEPEFIRAEVERFKELGFAVWMDDFGSGYSSLDVLQNIGFDLIKFDMRFMQQFNESERSRIILTEQLHMATSLGIDTICEGVETEEQAQFLQETGCTKLQGYYFCKPIPVEQILQRYSNGEQIGFENPEELPYYEAIGRVNLHDLSVIAQEKKGEFSNFFNTLPMAIIETNGTEIRYARSNQSYRDFMLRHFGLHFNNRIDSFNKTPMSMDSPFVQNLLKAGNDDGLLFMDETLPNGTLVRSCLRKIATNPVTGIYSVAVAVLSISDNSVGASYAVIAKALASDYFHLLYVDLNNESFYEYTSKVGAEELLMKRHEEDFFSKSRHDALTQLHPDDRAMFIDAFTKENIVRQLDKQGSFTLTYRLLMNGEPVYVNLKANRLQNDPGHLIIGVSNVDSYMKQSIMLEKARRDESIYTRLIALSGDYYCIYTVSPKTNEYTEYTLDDIYRGFGLPIKGDDMFEDARKNSNNVISEDDIPMFIKRFTKENVLNEISEKGAFSIDYHLIFSGRSVPVTLRAVLVKEDDEDVLLIGICKFDE
ncbi:MAG: EAL domain-containing protein [Ruminococcus sp.]|nr:EAL domain-containing protein [Ruminococcus sp.]